MFKDILQKFMVSVDEITEKAKASSKTGTKVRTEYVRDEHGRFAMSRFGMGHNLGTEQYKAAYADMGTTNRNIKVAADPGKRNPQKQLAAVETHHAMQERAVATAMHALHSPVTSAAEIHQATVHISRAIPTPTLHENINNTMQRMLDKGLIHHERGDTIKVKGSNVEVQTHAFGLTEKGKALAVKEDKLLHTVDASRPVRFVPHGDEKVWLTHASDWAQARQEAYPGNRATISGRQDARHTPEMEKAGAQMPPERYGKDKQAVRNQNGHILGMDGKPLMKPGKVVAEWGADGKPVKHPEGHPEAGKAIMKDGMVRVTKDDVKASIAAKTEPDVQKRNAKIAELKDKGEFYDVRLKGVVAHNKKATDKVNRLDATREEAYGIAHPGQGHEADKAAGLTANKATHVELDARSSVNGITAHLMGSATGLAKSHLLPKTADLIPAHAQPGGLFDKLGLTHVKESDRSKPYFDTLSSDKHGQMTTEDFHGLKEGKDGADALKKAAKAIFTPAGYGGVKGWAKLPGQELGGRTLGEHEAAAGRGYIEGCANHLMSGGMSKVDAIKAATKMAANFQETPITQFMTKAKPIFKEMPPNFVWSNPLSGQPVAFQAFDTVRRHTNLTTTSGEEIKTSHNQTDFLNMRRSVTAAIPNFVHSIDAAQMAHLSKMTGSTATVHDAIILPHNNDVAATQRNLNAHVATAYNALNTPVRYVDHDGTVHNYRGPVAHMAAQMKEQWNNLIGHTYHTQSFKNTYQAHGPRSSAHPVTDVRQQQVKENHITPEVVAQVNQRIDRAVADFFKDNVGHEIPATNTHFEE